MPSNHFILYPPLLILPSIFPTIRVFSSESVFHIRWLKYWNFSFSISPSNEYSGLISFRSDWLNLLEVQETLKSLLQHQSSKALILQCSAFSTVQLSHPYMTTGKKKKVIHTSLLLTKVKGFSIVNEAEVDVFLKFSCFFCDSTDVSNFISGSCAFSKSSLNIWKFSVHILLKPSLENFEPYFASM